MCPLSLECHLASKAQVNEKFESEKRLKFTSIQTKELRPGEVKYPHQNYITECLTQETEAARKVAQTYDMWPVLLL